MIRKAKKKDASRLAEILVFAKRTAYRSIFQDDNGSFNLLQVLDLALSFRDQEGTLKDLYVYEEDNIVKGLIHWHLKKGTKNSTHIQIEELYIDPFFQGQGIGKKLMTNCLKHARLANASPIFLWVLEENHKARKFYERFGFQPTDRKEFEPRTNVVKLEYAFDFSL